MVAFGGGHGLAAALAAWRRITPELTAVVTVADDGGSSGRIRREMPVLPPGDLRMALAALTGDGDRGRELAALLQHRLGGTGVLAGHPVGNLVLTGLIEMHGGNTVTALDALGEMLGCYGRVCRWPTSRSIWWPASRARSRRPGTHAHHPRTGGHRTTPGRVREIRLSPTDPPVNPAVLEAIAAADISRSGPGSWYTSVLPHLLVPQLRAALAASRPGSSPCSISSPKRARPTGSRRRSMYGYSGRISAEWHAHRDRRRRIGG